MSHVYGSDSVEAVVPVYNTNALDTAAAKYWQLAGQFEGECGYPLCDVATSSAMPHSHQGSASCRLDIGPEVLTAAEVAPLRLASHAWHASNRLHGTASAAVGDRSCF